MKKLFLVLTGLAVLALAPALAEQNTYFKSGSLVAQGGAALGLGGLGVVAGADLSLGQVELAPVFPLDWGVAARGALGFGSGVSVGAGGYATAHYSWKALKSGVAFLDSFETSLGLGVDFVLLPKTNLSVGGFNTYSYHFDRLLAVELGYYTLGGLTLGVTYKLN